MGEVRGRPAACPGPFNPPERHRTMSSSERDYLSGRRRHCINPQEKEGRRLESAREESGGRMASTFIPSGINLYMYRAGVLGRLSRCVIFIQWRERARARACVPGHHEITIGLLLSCPDCSLYTRLSMDEIWWLLAQHDQLPLVFFLLSTYAALFYIRYEISRWEIRWRILLYSLSTFYILQFAEFLFLLFVSCARSFDLPMQRGWFRFRKER